MTMSEKLYWDSVFAIAMALKIGHPGIEISQVSVQNIYDWTVELENFSDDPALTNDEILLAIFQEWFEEML